MTINMRKGEKYHAKGFEGIILAEAKWSSATDYDLYAIVLYKDGRTEHVATFGAYAIPAKSHNSDHSVVHFGDAGRGDGDSGEKMQLTMTDEIDAVLFVVYSAQSNGSGSFRRYGVEVKVTFGDEVVHIPADDQNANDGVYTMAPALIENTEEGPVLHALADAYSSGGENRPELKRKRPTLWGRAASTELEVKFDTGPRNHYK